MCERVEMVKRSILDESHWPQFKINTGALPQNIHWQTLNRHCGCSFWAASGEIVEDIGEKNITAMTDDSKR